MPLGILWRPLAPNPKNLQTSSLLKHPSAANVYHLLPGGPGECERTGRAASVKALGEQPGEDQQGEDLGIHCPRPGAFGHLEWH